MLLDETVTMVDWYYGGCGRGWRVRKRRRRTWSTGAATPAAAAVVVAAGHSGHEGCMDGQDAFAD